MGREDDDQRKEDWWFHRNRQLDRQDQQAATERELERLRLRGTHSSDTEAGDREAGERHVPDRSELGREIAGLHAEIAERLRTESIDGWRAEKWMSRLKEIYPLRPESVTIADELKDDIRSFLDTVTDWELGRRSLGSGMVIRNSLELTRFTLLNLKLTIEDHLRAK